MDETRNHDTGISAARSVEKLRRVQKRMQRENIEREDRIEFVIRMMLAALFATIVGYAVLII